MSKYVLALDQGTTSCRSIIFNQEGQLIASYAKEFTQIYPKPGWVEHDAEEIWQCQLETMREVFNRTDVTPQDVSCIGITNQRETIVIWDKETGKPIHNAIVWQCRRTTSVCDDLKSDSETLDLIIEKTGLVVDAYFSGTKIQWLLDNVDGAREKAKHGELLAGTIDTWLIWKLTAGKTHATDVTNASRTMLFNINNVSWDDELLALLNVPKCILPMVKDSSDDYGKVCAEWLGVEMPIYGVAGDQHAALFGQTCFKEGMAKNTYGTGCFLLMNTGDKRIHSNNNLLSTVAWSMNGKITYALEGSVFVAGAAVQWLRDELELIQSAQETDALAQSVDDTAGVYIVPAFVGLGAPHWDGSARGCIMGLTRGANRRHIVRATLESIAYQTCDVLEAMERDAKVDITTLHVDGGASANQFLMQFQADMLNTTVVRPVCIETTALGVAYMAGLKAGVWNNYDEIIKNCKIDYTFIPKMDKSERKKKQLNWYKAVERSKRWDEEK